MQNTQNPGRVEVICGCMFAGKTEELIRRLRRAEIADQSIQVFTPEIDDRYERESIGSHNGRDWQATVIEPNENGVQKITDATEYDVVAVDEFNFFTEAFVSGIEELAANGVRVIISGIDQTFRGEPFEPMHKAMAISDSIDKLTAVCEVCGGEAIRNQRLIDGEPAPAESPTVLVGGEDSYEARCRHCFVAPETVAQTKPSASDD